MPRDLTDYKITLVGTSANLSIPRIEIACKVIDSATGEVLKDFTGANSVTLHGVFGTLSNREKKVVLEQMIKTILDIKIDGLPPLP